MNPFGPGLTEIARSLRGDPEMTTSKLSDSNFTSASEAVLRLARNGEEPDGAPVIAPKSVSKDDAELRRSLMEGRKSDITGAGSSFNASQRPSTSEILDLMEWINRVVREQVRLEIQSFGSEGFRR